MPEDKLSERERPVFQDRQSEALGRVAPVKGAAFIDISSPPNSPPPWGPPYTVQGPYVLPSYGDALVEVWVGYSDGTPPARSGLFLVSGGYWLYTFPSLASGKGASLIAYLYNLQGAYLNTSPTKMVVVG